MLTVSERRLAFILGLGAINCETVTTRTTQIRTHLLLGFLAILHSAAVLALAWSWYDVAPQRWLWFGFATALLVWPTVLFFHSGRSLVRILLPAVIAAALFAIVFPLYAGVALVSYQQWRFANHVEQLLRQNPKIFLYAFGDEYSRPLVLREGYRRLGRNEIILPSDLYDDGDRIVRLDLSADPYVASTVETIGRTVDEMTDDLARENYGDGWQILRREEGAPELSEAEITASADDSSEKWDREPYKRRAVSGYAEITDREEQRALFRALAQNIRRGWNSAQCHTPHHKIYVETPTFAVSLSVCFDCENVYAFHSDDSARHYGEVMSGSIDKAAEPILNAALKRHDIPVPQRQF